MGGTEKEYTELVVQKGILNKVLLSWLLGRSLPVRTFPEVPPPGDKQTPKRTVWTKVNDRAVFT